MRIPGVPPKYQFQRYQKDPRWYSFDQLSLGMEELISKIERQGKRESMRKAMAPCVKTAKGRVPVATVNGGDLKRSLKGVVKTSKDKTEIIGIVGPDRRARGLTEKGEVSIPVFYAHLQEFGTSGHPAHPFMRPAFDENKNVVPRIYAEDIKRSIPKVAARIKARMDRKNRI